MLDVGIFHSKFLQLTARHVQVWDVLFGVIQLGSVRANDTEWLDLVLAQRALEICKTIAEWSVAMRVNLARSSVRTLKSALSFHKRKKYNRQRGDHGEKHL